MTTESADGDNGLTARATRFVRWRVDNWGDYTAALRNQARRSRRDLPRWFLREKVAASPLLPDRLRQVPLRMSGLRVFTTLVSSHCYFQSDHIEIGRHAFLNRGCYFEGTGPIVVGECTMLGPEVMILTSHHAIADDGSVAVKPTPLAVRIGDRCWIGARAVVLPGVTIGEGSVIAAGAVVSKDCEPHGVYGGVPARYIRSTLADERPASVLPPQAQIRS